MLCDVFAGNHYEIGQQIGKRYANWLERTLSYFIDYHHGEFSQQEMSSFVSDWETMLSERTPHLLEQVRGVCDGSGVNWNELLAMNFRFWNVIAQRRLKVPEEVAGCTNIAFKDPQFGIMLGGSLDDIQIPWHMASFAPKGGLKHVCVTWVGTGWAGRGINEAGLTIGNSSMDITGIDYDPLQRFEDFIMKHILENAKTVDEAIEIFRSMKPHKGNSYIIADANGNMKLFETCWAGEAVHDPKDDVLFCVNHVKSPVLKLKMQAMGYKNNPLPWSVHRHEFLNKQLSDPKLKRSWKNMQTLLADHSNFPNAMCYRLAAFVTIAAPQYAPRSLWVADGPSCRKPFKTLSVS